jgi:hypothetical protein
MKPCRFAVALLAGFALSASASISSAHSFDAPLKKTVIDFGLSPHNPPGGTNMRVELYCFLYPNFVVKQYEDQGEKALEWISLVPVRNKKTPPCTRAHVSGEIIISGPSWNWNGGLKGVKGNLLFFDADDGIDGGMPFVVYDYATRDKIFADNAYESAMRNGKTAYSPFSEIRVLRDLDGSVLLRYLRVVDAQCDLHSEKIACWRKVRKALGLRNARMPACTGYQNISGRYQSAVVYPVSVSLFPHPVIRTTDGPIRCWPVD